MGSYANEIVISMETGEVLSRSTVEYDGPWELCKGGNSKAEMNQANKLERQQLDLMQKQLGMVNPTLQKLIANGGMTPETQAALTSLTMNQLPASYNNLEGQLSNQLTQRGVTGGQNAGGGDIARTFGALGSQEAQAQQAGLSNIELQKQQGLFSSLGLAQGLVPTFNQGATSALGSGVTAANNADQASTGFWGSLFGALGTMGGGIGGGLASRQ